VDFGVASTPKVEEPRAVGEARRERVGRREEASGFA
jgi:hypothetical protein